MLQNKRGLHVVLRIDLVIVLPRILIRLLMYVLSILLLILMLILIIDFWLLNIHIVFGRSSFLFSLHHQLRGGNLPRINNIRIILLISLFLIRILNILLIFITHLSDDYILHIVINAQIDSRFHFRNFLLTVQILITVLILLLILRLWILIFFWVGPIFTRPHPINWLVLCIK